MNSLPVVKARLHQLYYVWTVLRTNISFAWAALRRLARDARGGYFKASLKFFLYHAQRALQQWVRDYYDDTADMGPDPHSERMESLRRKTAGLHKLMGTDEQFSFSILIPVYKPVPLFFEQALLSALRQTASDKEVLIGYDGEQPAGVKDVVAKLRREHPELTDCVKEFDLPRTAGGGISRTTNSLAAQATKRFLLLMDHDDWIRPDLLFRYEQTLRLGADLEKTVLYCDEYKINERNAYVLSSRLRKPEHPEFPYVFINWICHCLMVPRQLWQDLGGLRSECDGAQDFDFSLRVDLAGARMQNVPVPLYAWRAHSQSTAGRAESKDYATPAGIRALSDYVTQKHLDWSITQGLRPTTYRALPKLKTAEENIHVIIPFRDQGDMTLEAVRSCLAQKSCRPLITAVDNGSQDRSIATRLAELGVEVLRIDEPFNYSRLNNRGVRESRFRSQADVILFLNNDVILDPGALEEMLRWVHQPKMGAVGARLYYPNHHLQHGGVELSRHKGSYEQMMWIHTDHNTPDHFAAFSAVARTCDAVTAACMMVLRENFEAVGGFDETWYPIAYSDTNLCQKLRAKGLSIFYTPYATAIHHESVTRGYGSLEDYEASRWLSEKFFDSSRRS